MQRFGAAASNLTNRKFLSKSVLVKDHMETPSTTIEPHTSTGGDKSPRFGGSRRHLVSNKSFDKISNTDLLYQTVLENQLEEDLGESEEQLINKLHAAVHQKKCRGVIKKLANPLKQMATKRRYETTSHSSQSSGSSCSSIKTDNSLARADDQKDFKDGYFVKNMVQKLKKIEINSVSS